MDILPLNRINLGVHIEDRLPKSHRGNDLDGLYVFEHVDRNFTLAFSI